LQVRWTGVVALTAMTVAASGLNGCGGQSRSPAPSTTDTYLDHVQSAITATPTTTPAVAPEDLDPSSYHSLSARDFALLVKNPDASIGRKIVLYGVVIQLDTNTGQNSFIAQAGTEPGDYNEHAIFYAHDQSILSSVVAQDAVTIWCTVDGTETYQTQNNAERTVPKFWVNIIKDIGSTNPDQRGGG
jgi:hypothetical protein